MKIYDPTADLKTCCHISFEMLSSNLRLDSRDLGYLRHHGLKIDKKTVDENFVPSAAIRIHWYLAGIVDCIMNMRI